MRRTFLIQLGTPTMNFSPKILILGALFLWLSCQSSLVQALVPPITPSGLNTHVSGPIAVDGHAQYNITGGTRPGGGTNLFHSFDVFGVPPNNIANFLNETALPTSNILARVTGSTRSDIFGTIQTTDFGNANLFLMNPYGFLFGPNATVNVGGMVAFTSADYLRLATLNGSNAGIFHANTELTSLLTNAPVAAFGFLGSNPAAIEVQGSQLTLATGKGLSLVGGNITVRSDPDTGVPPLISAPSGQINLVSVASAGEVLFPSLATGANINDQTFTTMGTVAILGGSTLDVSDNALAGDGSGGTVRIRGGQFIMDGSFIFANTFAEANGSAIAIKVDMTGDISLKNASAISAAASSTGRVGDIEMTGNNVRFDGGAFISTISAESPGQGGNISVNSESLNLASGSSIFSGSIGGAVAGNIAIIATDSLNVSGFDPVFGTASSIESVAFAGGNSGNVNVQSARMTVAELGMIGTTSVGTGQAGNLRLQTGVLEVLDGGLIASSGGNGSGNITILADEVTVKGFVSPDQRSRIDNSGGGEGGTGDIRIQTDRLLLTDDARINMEGTGQLGRVMVSATESLTISNGGKLRMQNDAGSAGLIDLSSPQVALDQGIIQTLTVGPGDAGAVAIEATDVHIVGGQINTGTCPVSCGAIGGRGGNVSIVAENSAQFSGQFAGRNVRGQIDPAGPAGIFTVTGNSGGDAGNIRVMAPQIQIIYGAMLSARSTGSGNTGNIQITAGNQFTMTNSSVTTEANQASGGAIKITTTPSGTVELNNSTISASVHNGTGGGGNVDIDPLYVLMQNSQILARADQGPGGNITINITSGGLFLPDANSVVSAQSGNPALNGTVTIQSPNAPVSGQIQPLGKTPLIATSLLNQHCAALAGGKFSSFTMAGRDSLPTEPGSWLTSPMALGLPGTGDGTLHEKGGLAGVDDDPAHETTILSLRQIAPAGFLTQAFALDSSTSCQS
jgi:filamentous hemagglutinin family protein